MTDGVAPVTTRADSALVQALARAFRYLRMLDQGHYASITEMAAAEKIERGYLRTLLRLTPFAPDIVEAILDRRQPEGMTLARLLRPFPVEWEQQRDFVDWTLPVAALRGGYQALALGLAYEWQAGHPESLINRRFQDEAEQIGA
jgi:hypothetical protein